MHTPRSLLIVSALALLVPVHSHASNLDAAKSIDSLMVCLHERGQFNGSILVAVEDTVLYRNAFGEADMKSGRKFTPATVSCLASVSKTFTAAAVMILADEHKLRYDDEITHYLPELRRYAEGITIRHLLNHTSGIPDVGDLGIDHPRLTNDEVLHTLVKQKAPLYKPGTRYRYSNTGYVLLSIIVERVSGMSFADFLTTKIFRPLGMSETSVYEGSKNDEKAAAIGYNQFGSRDGYEGLTTGDG
ncbi:MAG TPA: serine hydrolase domain-containing protein, partial [Bacteroidota bacterium]|nr:serine hydrolase domain-containing protein [Bacteroidota bacterium]